MTNEEMVTRIQAGETELYEALWKSVRGSVWITAKRYWKSDQSITEADDLMQEAYFGFVKAVQKYDTQAKYKFTTALKFYISNACCNITYTQLAHPDPILSADTLDCKISDGDKAETFLDALIDENAEQRITELEESLDRTGAMDEIVDCFNRLPQITKKIIILHYCYEISFVELNKLKPGSCHGWSDALSCYGLRKVRSMLHEKGIDCRADAESMYYRHKSVAAFLSSGSSIVEDIAELQERIGEGMAQEVESKAKTRRDIEKLIPILEQLRPVDREIIIQHFFDNVPNSEICQKAKCAVSWARNRELYVLNKAKKEITEFESGKDVKELLYCIPKEAPELYKNLVEKVV